MRKTLFALAAVLALSVTGFAQLTTQSTTLSSALVKPNSYNPASLYDTVYVASTTGMLNPVFSGNSSAPQTWLYVDLEAMPVFNVVNSTTVQVIRGNPTNTLGTNPAPHISGATVFFGPYNNFVQGASVVQVGGLGSVDPSGACTPSNHQYLPLINAANGHLINCDTIGSSTYVWALTGQRLFVSPVGCGKLASTVTTTDNGMVPAATGNVVHQWTTNTTAGTTEITCALLPATYQGTGKGIIVTAVDFLYGAQTTAISSIAAATIQTVTYAASTSSGAAAAGTVATAGGSLTVTPTVLQLATTTSGLCYNEKLVFGTPFYANTDNVSLSFDQVFTNSAAATVYQSCGLEVYYDQPL